MKLPYVIAIVLPALLTACTTGQLHYTDSNGKRKLACDVEFTGMPSIDKYAVEYALSLCAKSATAKGYIVEQPELLTIDTTISTPPCGRTWDHELAKQQFKQGMLTKKQYGYIVAHIDLGLAKVNECS